MLAARIRRVWNTRAGAPVVRAGLRFEPDSALGGKLKLKNMVAGVHQVRKEMGLL